MILEGYRKNTQFFSISFSFGEITFYWVFGTNVPLKYVLSQKVIDHLLKVMNPGVLKFWSAFLKFLTGLYNLSGKSSVDSEHLNLLHNSNNNKWPSSCANLIQSNVTSSSANNDEKLAINNNNKPSNNLTMSLSHHHHHHQQNMHHHLSPFSSLPYLLDPLGNLQKSAASNNLFWTWKTHWVIHDRFRKLD